MDPSRDSPLLSVDSLGYEYGGRPALSDVSFQAGAGDLVALVGRNGAGKSTLLRCLAGWARPLSGEVRIAGLRVASAEREARRHVVLVPDTPSFYDELTAWEHLQFSAQARHLSNWEEEAEHILQRYGLWTARDAYPFTLSRGMRYKLAVCLALLLEPRLLLLDEPFGPLDPVSVAELWADLVRLCEEGMTVLFSSHQLPPEARPGRYLILEEGRLIAEGAPAGLQRSLGVSDPFSLEALLRAARGAGEEAAHA